MEQTPIPTVRCSTCPARGRGRWRRRASLPADALILDLEDAVAPAEKPRARELVAEAVAAGGYGGRKLLVRINGLDTEWGEADIAPRRRGRAGRDPAAQGRDARRDVHGAAELIERHGAPERTPDLGDDGDAARRC